MHVGALGGAWRGLLRWAEIWRGPWLPRLLLLLLLGLLLWLLLAVAPHSLLSIWWHLLKHTEQLHKQEVVFLDKGHVRCRKHEIIAQFPVTEPRLTILH